MKLNVPLALASLFLSILLWLHVQGEQALKVSRNVEFPLKVINLDSKFRLKSAPPKVQVMAEGTIEAYDRFKDLMASKAAAGIYAVVDLQDAVPEVSTYHVRLPHSDALSKIDLSFGEPTDAAIVVQEVIGKQFAVEVVPLNVPDGFVFSQARVQPSSVMIRGAATDLTRVAKVRALVNLAKEMPGKAISCNVEVLDDQGKPMIPGVTTEPESVAITPALAVAPPERPLIVAVQIAQGVGPAPGYRLVGYSVEPVTAMVRGDQKLLQRLQSIPTEPISLSGMKAGRNVRRVRLLPQTGIQLQTSDTVRVTLEIEAIQPIETPPTTGTAPPKNP